MENEIQKTEPQKTELVSPLAHAAQLCQGDGGMDVGKLKELLELQERWDATQAKKAYTEAMAKFKANPPEIIKDKTVNFNQTNYSHASLYNVTSCINKALSEHGLAASWVTSQDNGLIMVTCKITHIGGHSESTCLSAPPDASGSKNPIQAMGSTVTYLERYTLLALTGLATCDQDDDGAGADKKPTGPKKPTTEQDKVMDAICKALEDRTKKKIIRDRVAGIFFVENGKYPQGLNRVGDAVLWLINQDRQDEWTEKVDMAGLMETISQAYFEFETLNQAYLQDNDGKVEFTQDMFIKAITRVFGTLPTNKTVSEIAEAVKPEDVSVRTGE